MDLISILIALVVFGIVFYIGYYIITTCFPEPIRKVALMILGLIALLVLLGYFTGGVYLPHRAVVVN